MKNNLLAQYYNEQFKQQLDPPFETLTPEDVIRIEKILKNSLGFAAWKLGKSLEQTEVAFKEYFKKIEILKSMKNERFRYSGNKYFKGN